MQNLRASAPACPSVENALPSRDVTGHAFYSCCPLKALRRHRRRRHRYLLNDTDPEALQRRHALGMVGEQPDGVNIQPGKNLCTHADLALRFPLVRGDRWPHLTMKGQALLVVHMEALGALVQVN